MPHDMIYVCERCRTNTELYFVRSVDEFLCEECLMRLAREQPTIEEPNNEES